MLQDSSLDIVESSTLDMQVVDGVHCLTVNDSNCIKLFILVGILL
jgi:hypothetical protein